MTPSYYKSELFTYKISRQSHRFFKETGSVDGSVFGIVCLFFLVLCMGLVTSRLMFKWCFDLLEMAIGLGAISQILSSGKENPLLSRVRYVSMVRGKPCYTKLPVVDFS